jgi:hypothetical protein
MRGLPPGAAARVLPLPAARVPFTVIEFEGMTVTPSVDSGGVRARASAVPGRATR